MCVCVCSLWNACRAWPTSYRQRPSSVLPPCLNSRMFNERAHSSGMFASRAFENRRCAAARWADRLRTAPRLQPSFLGHSRRTFDGGRRAIFATTAAFFRSLRNSRACVRVCVRGRMCGNVAAQVFVHGASPVCASGCAWRASWVCLGGSTLQDIDFGDRLWPA